MALLSVTMVTNNSSNNLDGIVIPNNSGIPIIYCLCDECVSSVDVYLVIIINLAICDFMLLSRSKKITLESYYCLYLRGTFNLT